MVSKETVARPAVPIAKELMALILSRLWLKLLKFLKHGYLPYTKTYGHLVFYTAYFD